MTYPDGHPGGEQTHQPPYTPPVNGWQHDDPQTTGSWSVPEPGGWPPPRQRRPYPGSADQQPQPYQQQPYQQPPAAQQPQQHQGYEQPPAAQQYPPTPEQTSWWDAPSGRDTPDWQPRARDARSVEHPAWPEPAAGPSYRDPQPGYGPQVQPGYGPPAPYGDPRMAAPGQPGSAAADDLPFLDRQVRGRLAGRLIQVNSSHARHAADNLRTKDDLCEHMLVIFSGGDPRNPHFKLSVATRAALSDESNQDVVEVLRTLCTVVQQQLDASSEQGRSWDPRTPMTGLVNRSADFTADMTYLGVGISTLDTAEMPWRAMKGQLTRWDGLRQKGRGYLWLADNTAVQIDRASMSGGSGMTVISANRGVDCQYQSVLVPNLLGNADEGTFLLWQQLERLHQLLSRATSR